MARGGNHRGGRLVYSTEEGQICPGCRRAQTRCTCAPAAPRTASDGIVRVERQTKGRKGKGVTVIRGIPLPPKEVVLLASRLKKLCGTGGTVKVDVIEIQGDHRDLLVAELKKEGWTVKKSGG